MSSNQLQPDPLIKLSTAEKYSSVASQAREEPVYGCSCQIVGPPLSREEIFAKASSLGYSIKDIRDVPNEVLLVSMGCGNPTRHANFRPGELVLDIGCGAGLDSILSSKAVGRYGTVLAADLSRRMLELGKRNSRRMNMTNIEFVLCDGENLPIRSGSVDHVIANCSINLMPNKQKVLEEAYRTVKESGHVTLSDIASVVPMPEEVKRDLDLWAACISGVIAEDLLLQNIKVAGFKSIEIIDRKVFHYGEKDRFRIRKFFAERSDIVSSVLDLENKLETLVVKAEKKR